MPLRRDPTDFVGRLRDIEDAIRELQRGPSGTLAISGDLELGDVRIYAQTDDAGVTTLSAILASDDTATPILLATLS